MIGERWADIEEFPNYMVSDQGRIFSHHRNRVINTSPTNHGHIKIGLYSEETGEKLTRSVSNLVAEAFISPPNANCDSVVVLDGNLSNVSAENLVWRPRWFAWKYTNQLKGRQPLHYRNLAVTELNDGFEYSCVIEAGMTLGLLFGTIWRSTYTGIPCYPTDSIFEVTERV